MSPDLARKYETLKSLIASYGRVAVAFSGGVDSSLLSAVAHDVLGADALAITAVAPLVPARELADAQSFCAARGIRHELIHPDPLAVEGVRTNAPDRCYVCKKAIFTQIFACAHEQGIDIVADGSNLDDLGDYRPGLAALEEMQVASPLREANMTKQDIRDLSQGLGLPTWSKQSSACLATRYPYGEELTEEKLARADAAEDVLLSRGFTQVRVRVHGDVARIELPPARFADLLEDQQRLDVTRALQALGFDYVTLDLLGYRTGSMNETLNGKDGQ